MKKAPKKGRPFGPPKVSRNVMVLKSTDAELTKRAKKTGLSRGQIIDALLAP